MKIDPKRAGLIAFGLVALILVIEVTLSALRVRAIDISFRVDGERPPTAAQNPTPAPDQPTGPETLYLAPSSDLVMEVRWTYTIGPRFPVTTIRAEMHDDAGKMVSAASHVITCGESALQCEGDTPVTLAFGVVNGAGQDAQWPVGRYTVTVTRAYAGVSGSPVQLVQRSIAVLNN